MNPLGLFRYCFYLKLCIWGREEGTRQEEDGKA